jgi:Domain of unknown function (DUF3291)
LQAQISLIPFDYPNIIAMYLAQINIAKLLAPIDSPLLEDFVADLDRINTIADDSKGFVWRLKEDNGSAVNIDVFNDKSLIVNMSVWESVEDLKNFAYRSDHIEIFMKRAKWFERMTEAHAAMWWIEANGFFPTATEGRDRLLYLRTHGESAHAFSFKKIIEKPA